MSNDKDFKITLLRGRISESQQFLEDSTRIVFDENSKPLGKHISLVDAVLYAELYANQIMNSGLYSAGIDPYKPTTL